MIALWMGSALAGPALVDVQLGWKGEEGRLVVHAPEGYEIGADAPADLTLRFAHAELSHRSSGGLLTSGVAVPVVPEAAFEGELALQLCSKADGVCSPGSFRVSGTVPAGKKGRIALVVQPGHEPGTPASDFNTDAAAVADVAFERAKSSGKPVVLDFSAVWCPPCNLLAAEVLHAPDAHETLADFEVAVVDVDHPSSWALKDRYAVGGYPTVVVVDPAGEELDRIVGYPGRDRFLGFLGQLSEDAVDWAATDPASLGADEAARGWWAQLEDGKKELEAWAEAAAPSESVWAHLARMRTAPNPDDAAWLADHAPEHTLDWVPWIGPWGDTDAAKAPVRRALKRAVLEADPVEAADLLWFAAQVAGEDEAPTLYAAAHATLSAHLTGDDRLDRGHYTFLASLQARAGDLDGAVAFMDAQTASHPDEPTFLLKAASLLDDAGRHAEALERTQLALGRSWGDNKLRVALAHAEALSGAGRQDEAREFAARILAELDAPDEGVKVRTHRYRERLAGFTD